MKKILLATAASLALLGAAGCTAPGKAPGIGKGKAPVAAPAPAPIVRKG